MYWWRTVVNSLVRFCIGFLVKLFDRAFTFLLGCAATDLKWGGRLYGIMYYSAVHLRKQKWKWYCMAILIGLIMGLAHVSVCLSVSLPMSGLYELLFWKQIGVEKPALVWTFFVSRVTGVPIFSSKDHNSWSGLALHNAQWWLHLARWTGRPHVMMLRQHWVLKFS